jgi:hypothetical protein
VTENSNQPTEAANPLVAALLADAGPSVRVVILYGSRLQHTRPNRFSATDLVVIVDDYKAFYTAMAGSGALHRPPWLMALFASFLPPNVHAYTPEHAQDQGIAKCQILSIAHFERAMGSRPKDHFVLGRMIQRIGVAWAASADDEAWLTRVISGAHDRVIDWMAPFVSNPFDSRSLGRQILEVSYGAELRPEAKGRAVDVFHAQEDHLTAALLPGLERRVRLGTLIRDGDRFYLASPPRPRHVSRWRRHFRRTKRRSTLRWFKHVVTFDNWLPYLLRKAERRTGRSVELTLLERKIPLIFLWPRAIHFLLTLPAREDEPED